MASLNKTSATSITDLGGVSIVSAASGDLFYFNGTSWTDGTPDQAGVVSLASDQTITSIKTFAARIAMSGQTAIRFYDSDSSNFTAFRAAATISNDVTWILPSAEGAANSYLKTNGAGTLSFAAPTISELSDGDAVAKLTGRSGGQSLRGGTDASESLTLDSTTSSTKGEVRIASGNTLAMVNNAGIRFYEATSNGTSKVTLTVPSSLSADYTFMLPSAQGTTGDYLRLSNASSGETAWTTLTVSHANLTNLTSDDHPQYALLAGRTSGQTIAGGANASGNLTLDSTLDTTKGQVRIAGGSVFALRGSVSSVGTIHLYENENGSGNYVGLKAAANINSDVMFTLPSSLPTGASQYLTCNETTGVMSWASVAGSGGGGAIESNGATIDTLDFETGDGFSVDNVGNTNTIGISNDALPIYKLSSSGSAYQIARISSDGSAVEWGTAHPTVGGTGITSYTTGDLLYASGSNTLSKLAVASTNPSGKQLSLNYAGTTPEWAEPGATEVDSGSLESDGSSGIRIRRTGWDADGTAVRTRLHINGKILKSTTAVGLSGGVLSASTGYYIYAYDDSGVLTLEASTTPPSSGSGVDGYQRKFGDNTRRYLGRAMLNSSANYQVDAVVGTINRFWPTRDLWNDLRLSLDSTHPCPDTVSNGTSLYLHPYVGNRISLYNGPQFNYWEPCLISGVKQFTLSSLGCSSTATNYDIFAYSDFGQVKLRAVAWTNGTTRAENLTRANTYAAHPTSGVLCKANRSITTSGVARSGTTVTVTTSGDHNLVVGQMVAIAAIAWTGGTSPVGTPANFFVLSTPSSTTFTFTTTVSDDGGSYSSGGDVTELGEYFRYLGTIRTTGSANTTTDTVKQRFVWNFYHRVKKRMIATDTGNSAYTGTSYRQTNANSANLLEFVVGVDTTSGDGGGADAVTCDNVGMSDGTSSGACRIGIGYNSTTTNSADFNTTNGTTSRMPLIAKKTVHPSAGYQYFCPLELGAPDTTFYYVANSENRWACTAEVWG